MKKFPKFLVFFPLLFLNFLGFGQICSKGQLPVNLQQGLVAYYPFCGNTNDESGFGNHIQNFGATLVNDQLGNTSAAYRFDGLSTYMQIPYASSYEALTDNFTFSFWIKNNKISPHDAMHIIHRNDGCFTLGIGGNSELGFARQGQAVLLVSDSTLKNEWIHVLFTMNGLTKSLYLNGVLNKSVVTDAGVINSVGAGMNIGIASPGGNGGAYRLEADISQLMWYNRVLTAEEVSLLYNSLGGLDNKCETFSQINLLSDTTTLYGLTPKLSVAEGYANYLWNTGDTSSLIDAIRTGLYTVAVQTQEGCTLTDSTYLLLNDLEIIASDTLLCGPSSITLSVSVDKGSFKYVGSFGESDYYIDTISRSWPQAREAARAQGMDLWVIENQEENDSVYNRLPHAENVYVNYWIGLYQDRNSPFYSEPLGGWKWVDGTLMNYSNWLGGDPNNQSGWAPGWEDYGLMWTSPFHGKWNDFYSEIQDPSIIGLFKTLAVAEKPRKKYTWSTGDTTTSIAVTPLVNTDYVLTVDDNGIIFSDTISIKVFTKVEFNLLPDTLTICGDSAILDAGSGYQSYIWNTGDTTSQINSRYSGIYSVTVTDVNGCISSDTTFLSLVDANIVLSDTLVCVGDSIILSSRKLPFSVSGQYLPGSLSNGLVASFPFNGNANDKTGNGNNGTVYGASLTNDRFGNANSAYNFDGINDYILTDNTSSTGITGDLTISLWMNTRGRELYNYNNFQTLVTKRDVGNVTYEMDLYFGGATKTYSVISGKILPPSFQYLIESQTIDYINRWDHYVLVNKNDTGFIYLNGQKLSTPNGNIFPFTSQVANSGLTFGSAGGTQFFNGKLDDIFIWNRALSPKEIEGVKNLNQNYSIRWSTGDTTSSITVSPRETTTYTLTVTDGITTCTDQVTITVNQVDTSLTALDTTAICVGGSARLQAGTGTSYVWLKNGSVINGASSSLYSATSAGSYRVIVTNASGCSDTSAVITITERPVPVSGTITGGGVAVCSGTNSTAMTLTGSVGAIRWQSSLDSLVFTDIAYATSSGYTATNLTATTYYRVITTNNCGSDTSAVVKVLVNPTPVARFSVDNATQILRANLFVFTNISTPSVGVSYYWDFDNGFFSNLKNPSFGYRAVGTYQVKLKVTTNAGCVDSTSITVEVRESPVAVNDVFTTAHATAVSGNASTNDTPSPDGGNIWSLVGTNGGAAGGTATMTTAGIFTYTPRAGYSGTDTIRYQVCDINGDCMQANILVTVAAAPPPPPAAGNLFAAGATCATFNNGSAARLSQICYTVKAGTAPKGRPAPIQVSAVTPASFMYYVKVTAPSASFTVNIGQTVSQNGFRLFTVNTGGSQASGDNCVRVASVTTPSTGQARVSITRATVGRTYIIGVRYDTKSLVGYTTTGTISPVYTFSAKIGNLTLPNSTSSVTAYPNNCANAPAGIVSSRMPDSKEINSTSNAPAKSLSITNLKLKAYPNPTSHYFNVVVEGGAQQTDGMLRVMNMVGQLIEEKKQVKPGQLIQIGHLYINGMYLIEYTQGTNRAVLKVSKH